MSALNKMNKINDICLFVKDFKGSVDFFQNKFGFKLIRLQPNEVDANYAEFEFHGTSLTLWDQDGIASVVDATYLGEDGHHFMIAIKVNSVDDVNAIHDELTKNGVTCIKAPTDYEFGSRASYYLDYEENIWEVFAWSNGGMGPGIL